MDIVDVQFPLARNDAGLRQSLKRMLGRVLMPLYPRRVSELQHGEIGAALGRVDRLLLAALIARHERAGTLGQLGALHDWLWASEQAVRFHDQAQARFDGWWLQHHSAIVEPLRQELAARPQQWTTLCEIGCGSGLVLADMAQRLPALEMIGLDLCAAQISRNRERFAAQPRLRFESGDAAAWLHTNAKPGWVLFSNAGVLEYFSPAKLSGLLRELAQGRAPVAIASVEPIAEDHDLEREADSRIYGAERSWSHNYPRLYRDAGFETVWQRELRVDGVRWLLLLARAG